MVFAGDDMREPKGIESALRMSNAWIFLACFKFRWWYCGYAVEFNSKSYGSPQTS